MKTSRRLVEGGRGKVIDKENRNEGQVPGSWCVKEHAASFAAQVGTRGGTKAVGEGPKILGESEVRTYPRGICLRVRMEEKPSDGDD